MKPSMLRLVYLGTPAFAVPTLERIAAAGHDYKLMRQRIDELNQATNHLAELVMNGALQSAFEGKRLDDV